MLAPRIWVSQSNQTAFGLDIGTRMTMIDLDGTGRLLVHSPIQSEIENVQKLVQVEIVILPNKWRRVPLEQIIQVFPEAKIYGAPGIEKIEKRYAIQPIPDDPMTAPWARAVDHLLVEGAPFFNEVAFLHRSSRTLILSDLAGFMYDNGPLTSQLAMKLLKSKKQFGWTEQEKKLYIRDHKLFGDSLEKLLAWDFDRIIVSHGPLIEKAGRTVLHSAFSEKSTL